MPMWISWRTNTKTERIYNYASLGTPDGDTAIRMAQHCLAERFRIPVAQVKLTAERAPWFRPPQGTTRERT